MPLLFSYGTDALLGLLVIFISGLLLEKSKGRLILANKQLTDEIEIRKAAEEEQQKLIVSLQKTHSEIKILQGIIPSCARCKQIRDNQGPEVRWSHISKNTQKLNSAMDSARKPIKNSRKRQTNSFHPDEKKLRGLLSKNFWPD